MIASRMSTGKESIRYSQLRHGRGPDWQAEAQDLDLPETWSGHRRKFAGLGNGRHVVLIDGSKI